VSPQLSAADFTAGLRGIGAHRATGVPCGHLAGPWTLFERAEKITPAASEGAALAVAAGWQLAGGHGVVLCQNSGFGNLINPLTSLVLPYRIPVLVAMTLRGWPDPADDEPQHAVMGASTQALLAELGVAHTVLDPTRPGPAFSEAVAARTEKRPFFILVPRGSIGRAAPVTPDPPVPAPLTRPQVVALLLARLTDELLVTTTGYLSRQAHYEHDRPETFYMQGSMGHAAAIGLGLATERPDRRVVVLDGDGAFLMHLGTGSTIAGSGVSNLVHVVVDNGCYESTGCQPSTSGGVDWQALGHGLGYRTVLRSGSDRDAGDLLDTALDAAGPVLCVLTVRPTPGEVHPRATAESGLDDIAARFHAAATGSLDDDRR
jgi:phosphonopyruvate decarboxylase